MEMRDRGTGAFNHESRTPPPHYPEFLNNDVLVIYRRTSSSMIDAMIRIDEAFRLKVGELSQSLEFKLQADDAICGYHFA